jgi:pimeloyl-ACP methyl ester carboxylesterase
VIKNQRLLIYYRGAAAGFLDSDGKAELFRTAHGAKTGGHLNAVSEGETRTSLRNVLVYLENQLSKIRNQQASILRIAVFFLVCAALTSQSSGQNGKAAETEHRLKKVRVNGVELHYLDIGKGTPVIFVHGGLDDYRVWEAQLEPFAQSYRVIAYSRRYNFPNHNPHIRPDHSAIIEAEDLAALIKSLKLGRVHVVGYSYGAFTALFLVVKHPELVRSLVLAEPPVLRWAEDKPEGKALFDEFMGNIWKPVGDAFRRGEKEQALRLTLNYFAGEGVYDQVAEVQRIYWRNNIREWEALTMSRDANPPLSREDVKRIKAPVLMLSGAQTLGILKFVDNELQPLLSNGERLVIPNATHEMWSEQPDVCRRAVLGFLSRN